MTAGIDSLFPWLPASDALSWLLLLTKLTLLLGLVLLVHRLSQRRAAAFRHAILGSGVMAIPLLLVCHFMFPAWFIPVPSSWLSHWKLVEATTTESREETSDELAHLPIRCDAGTRPPRLPAISEFTCSSTAADIARGASQTGAAGTGTQQVAGSMAGDQATKTSLTGWSDSARWWLTVLAAIWLGGAALFFSRLLLARLVLGHRVRMAGYPGLEKLRQAGVATPLARQLVTKNIRIKVSRSEKQMPLGTGLFQKTILLPATCSRWSPAEWQAVLLHEQAHFTRNDCWTNLAARLQQVLLWFHPLSHVLVRKLRAESEIACDNRVIESGVSGVDYADVLFRIASAGRSSRSALLASVTMCDSVSLEWRMKSILGAQTPRARVSRCGLLGLAAVTGLLLGPVATAGLLTVVPDEERVTISNSARSDAAGEQDVSGGAFQPGYNITLKPVGDEVTYGDEFVGSCTDELVIASRWGQLKIPFDDIRFLDFPGRDASGPCYLERKDGSRISGTVQNSSLQFTLDTDYATDGVMTREVPASAIRFAAQISHAGLQAGQVTDGVATSKLTYHLRAPESHEAGKTFPAIVLLHKNNSNSRNYISEVVETWPEIAARYVLIGINGEVRARGFDRENPRYSYTGLSYVGHGSEFRGFPGTRRESPVAIAEAIRELDTRLELGKVFVVGHGNTGYTSGGNAAYHIQTWFPEVADGVVALAGGSLVQCNVSRFSDEEIMRRQRETPLVIGDGDPNASDRTGLSGWANQIMLDNRFPMVRYLQNGAGRRFAAMPFDQAIGWLERMTVTDPEEALEIAETLMSQGEIRDAIALTNRFVDAEFPAPARHRREAILRAIDEGARPARRFRKLLTGKSDAGGWFPEFLEFRQTWEFAAASRECMQAFQRLRLEQQEPARKLMDEARAMDRAGEPATGSTARYREIVENYFASRYYLQAKSILDSRDKN